MTARRWLACAVVAAGAAGVVRDLRQGLTGCAAMVVINVLAAETLLAAGVWSPDRGLIVVVVVTALIGAVQLPPVRKLAGGHAPKWRAAVRRLERL